MTTEDLPGLFGPGPVQGSVPPVQPETPIPAVSEEVQHRAYQDKALADMTAAFRLGQRRMLLVIPTGGGKTVVAAHLVKRCIAKGSRVLFLAHRRELVGQCAGRLEKFGVPHGVIMASAEGNGDEKVQVASIQTLWVRGVARKTMDLPPADILIIDEAHRSMGGTYLKLIEHYGKAVVVGLTATPVRSDGRGLGNVYETMVLGPTVKELTDQHFLVPVRYFAPSVPDLKGVKVTAGDYNEKQLEERMDKPELVGDIVQNWGRINAEQPRQTIVFATSVQHSINLMRQFREVGVTAEHLDGNTPVDERADILYRLKTGKTRVVCNCMVLTEGFDCPPVSCIVLARPTKSLGLYLQMAGRALRPFPGKKDTILIDHSGAVYEHGKLDDPMPWKLDAAEKIQTRQKALKKERKPKTCQKCKAVFRERASCPECGHFNVRFGSDVATTAADLLELDGVTMKEERDRRRQFYAELLGYCSEKGYQRGWAYHKFKAKFKTEPNFRAVQVVEPSVEVRSWIRSQQIAWAKSKRNPRNQNGGAS